MLIYNTTYQTGIDDARNFVIWLSESYIPEVEKTGILQNPRLTHILSHKEQDSECFSLQWEVEDTAALHRWHTQQGMHLNEEMMNFLMEKDKFMDQDFGKDATADGIRTKFAEFITQQVMKHGNSVVGKYIFNTYKSKLTEEQQAECSKLVK